jgi:DNA-binding NtrC family response regulator
MPDKKSEQIRVLSSRTMGRACRPQQLIRGWGFDVETAGRDEALQKSQTFRPVIVLTDLVMPKMGGSDRCAGCSSRATTSPRSFLTAQGTVETAVEAIKLGA